jgi:serine-type D-Ala-D-Ala carboxypeptidase
MSLRVGTVEEAGMSPTRVRRVIQLAEGWVRQDMLRALVLLVVRRGIVALHEAFGTLGPEPDSPPVARDSIFQLASVTKPITATAVMGLVEDGLLGLNRPVAEYIPEFVGDGKSAVTLYHLLTHTSGLRGEDVDAYITARFNAEGISPPLPAAVTPDAYLSQGYGAPLWKPPGEEMSYSDYGYQLLGEIVRRVSGQPLDVLAYERIFLPLDMCDTSFVYADTMRPRLVRLRPEDLPPDGIGYPSWVRAPRGDDGSYSTALDLARFGQMFLDHGGRGDARVLSPASVAKMTRNQIPGISAHFINESFAEASWGLGWSVEGDKRYRFAGSLRSSATFSHLGWGGLFIWVDPMYDLVGVYLSVFPEPNAEMQRWPLDLFMDAVTAAVLDA